MKITRTKDRPIDARIPNISISHKTYLKVLRKLRRKAKIEKRKLLTEDGVEDYSCRK